jgi:O-antigen ligase
MANKKIYVLNIILNAFIEMGFYISILFLLFITKYPLYFQGFGAIISIFFWCLKCLVNRKWIYKHYPWHWTELLLCSWIWIGLFWSVQPHQTILYGIIFTSGCIIEVLLVSVFQKKEQVLRIVLILFLLLVGYAIYFILQNWKSILPLLQWGTIWRSQLEVYGAQINFGTPIGGRNSLGGLYSLLVPFSCSIAIFGICWKEFSHRKWLYFVYKSFFLGTTILFFSMVVFSGSRGSSVGMIFGLLCLILSNLQWQWTLIAGYATAILVSIPTPRNWFTRILLETLSGDMARIFIWQNSMELFHLVWIGGTGLGTFQYAYKMLFTPENQKTFIHAHNIFLNVGIELGLIGVVLFTILSLQFIIYGISSGRKNRHVSPFFASIHIGLASLVFGYIIRCLFDYTI